MCSPGLRAAAATAVTGVRPAMDLPTMARQITVAIVADHAVCRPATVAAVATAAADRIALPVPVAAVTLPAEVADIPLVEAAAIPAEVAAATAVADIPADTTRPVSKLFQVAVNEVKVQRRKKGVLAGMPFFFCATDPDVSTDARKPDCPGPDGHSRGRIYSCARVRAEILSM